MTDKTVGKLSLRNVQATSDRENDLLMAIPTKKARRAKRKILKRKIQHDWKDSEIIRLIAAVEKEPSIWMDGPLQYKSTRTHCWNAIVASLAIDGVDVNEAKTKWSSLRVTFRLNLSKINNNSNGVTGNTVVWRYFNQMSFLNPSYLALSNMKEETCSITHTSPSPPSTTRRRPKRRCTSVAPSNLYSALAPAAEPVSPAPASETPLLSASPAAGMDDGSSNSPTPVAALSSVSAVLRTESDGCFKTDTNTAFCEYLLSEMQTLSAEQARALRQHLSRTLLTFMESVMEM